MDALFPVDSTFSPDDATDKYFTVKRSMEKQNHPIHKAWYQGFMMGFSLIADCAFDAAATWKSIQKNIHQWIQETSEHVCLGLLACVLFCDTAIEQGQSMLEQCLIQATRLLEKIRMHHVQWLSEQQHQGAVYA
jgi:hypothetical protein